MANVLKQLRKKRDEHIKIANQFQRKGDFQNAVIHRDIAVGFEAQALRQERIQHLKKEGRLSELPSGTRSLEKLK